MTTKTTNTPPMTLEEVSRQKKEVLRQIRAQRNRIYHTANQLFAPAKSVNKVEMLMNSVNSGIAMYDGVMTGLRLMRRIRGWFKK